jgi:predicted nucleic acid-binding protein
VHSRRAGQVGPGFIGGHGCELEEAVQGTEIERHSGDGTAGPWEMIGVIDTSALIRLYIPDGPIPEGVEEFLRGVERGNHIAIAPELLLVESANVLNKKRKINEITEAESIQLLNDILSLPIRYFPHGPFISTAFDLAREHEITLYDAVYLALAVEQGAVLFSADKDICRIAGKLFLS